MYDFPLTALLLGALITLAGAFIENDKLITVGSNFITAAGTAYQVQNNQLKRQQSPKNSASASTSK